MTTSLWAFCSCFDIIVQFQNRMIKKLCNALIYFPDKLLDILITMMKGYFRFDHVKSKATFKSLSLRHHRFEIISHGHYCLITQVASVTFDLLFLLVLGSYLIVLFCFLVITTRVWIISLPALFWILDRTWTSLFSCNWEVHVTLLSRVLMISLTYSGDLHHASSRGHRLGYVVY